ncbi:hypothetical protein LguiB_018064 [Lonicera macranthoides]
MWPIGNIPSPRLIIRNSSLEGPIPNSILNMSSLKIIDLRENNLTGSLPMGIYYNLPVLQELYLDKNQLTGQIPSSLWECRGLQLLSLADNKLTGSISKNIGNLTYPKVPSADPDCFLKNLMEQIEVLFLIPSGPMVYIEALSSVLKTWSTEALVGLSDLMLEEFLTILSDLKPTKVLTTCLIRSLMKALVALPKAWSTDALVGFVRSDVGGVLDEHA